MSKACILLAAAVLSVTASAIQAQEKLQPPKQTGPATKEILPAPLAISPGAKQTQTAPTDVAPKGEAMPVEAACEAEANACGSCASECAGSHQHLTCEQFKRWLFFCPEKGPGLCGCCKQFQPCCHPPLYTFFLCREPYCALPPRALPAHTEEADGCCCGHKLLQFFHRPACCEVEQPKTECEAAGNAAIVSWEEPIKSKK